MHNNENEQRRAEQCVMELVCIVREHAAMLHIRMGWLEKELRVRKSFFEL